LIKILRTSMMNHSRTQHELKKLRDIVGDGLVYEEEGNIKIDNRKIISDTTIASTNLIEEIANNTQPKLSPKELIDKIVSFCNTYPFG
jgi:hypothetical protein